jgi:UDP-2,3-diacylglucosamine hydrolase
MLKHYSNAQFISDLHLTEDRPDCIRAFLNYLDNLEPSTDALFILGDFFDYWVGDDVTTPLTEKISAALSNTKTNKKIDIYFLPGNRDFAIGKQFCRESSMTLIQDNEKFIIDDLIVMVCHGDLFCTDDKSYQRFRKVIRNPIVMFLLLKLSKSRRIAIAKKLRAQSKQKFLKSQYMVDVNSNAISNTCNMYRPDVIVHGHTHLADIHYHQVNSRQVTRMVLGDWHAFGWSGTVTNAGPILTRFKIEQSS